MDVGSFAKKQIDGMFDGVDVLLRLSERFIYFWLLFFRYRVHDNIE